MEHFSFKSGCDMQVSKLIKEGWPILGCTYSIMQGGVTHTYYTVGRSATVVKVLTGEILT